MRPHQRTRISEPTWHVISPSRSGRADQPLPGVASRRGFLGLVAVALFGVSGVGAACSSGSSDESPRARATVTGSGTAAAGTPTVASAADALQVPLRAVQPEVTDPAIRAGDSAHLVAEPSGTAVGKLFVFFPGTGAQPEEQKYILQFAAAAGYHAVGLSYRNELAVVDLCKDPSQPDCQENVRLEVITGEDRSALVQVDRPNSIENRLSKLLAYLGWGEFLSGTSPRWESIAFSGHSQGGGHAAMLGKLHTVHRVVMFASTEPAVWTRTGHATPSDRYYGFANTTDPLYRFVTQCWSNLQLPGELTSVDSLSVPFGGSHRLETSVPARPGSSRSNAHNEPVVDAATPLDAEGVPLLADIWRYLIGP